MQPSKVYFAARSTNDIGKALIGRLDQCLATDPFGLRRQYDNAYRHYYGRDFGLGITSGVVRGGEIGELSVVRINNARALAKAYLALVTNTKITWRPMARNSDSGAARATTLAANLLEDYWKNRQMSRHVYRWTEQAFVFSEAFSFPEWDLGQGPVVAALGDRMVRGGDFTFHNIPPWDLFRDSNYRSSESMLWRMVRIYKNKWDLAKLVTKTADGKPAEDKILASTENKEMAELSATGRTEQSDDLVPVYYFFHAPSPSLPMGRETVLLSADCVLKDSKLTYSEVPIYRMAADEMTATPFAWSSWWDILGAQELYDALQTAVATNQTALATQCIAIENGSELDPDDLVGGMRVWRYPRGSQPPKAVQLTQSPPEIFPHMKDIVATQRQMIGMNDAALGQPQGKELNAQAFALLASMAVQQASPFQEARTDAVAQLGGGILKTLRARVTKERTLQIVGQSSASLFSEEKYTGEQLSSIEKVIVDIGNPMEQSPAGRASILQMMMSVEGVIKTGEEIQQVMETGRLEPATRALRDELLLLKSEYEQLSQGINPPVHFLQNHVLHFRENKSVLDNPEALKNPQVLEVAQKHLDQHYLELYGVEREMDPLAPIRVRDLLGQAPPLGFMPGAPPPGQSGTPPPAPGKQNSSMPGVGAVMAPAGPQQPATPPTQLPPNPMTGAQFNSTDGGGVVAPR